MPKQLLSLAAALSITATGIQTAQRLNKTPFLGGQGRNALLHLQAAVGGAGVIKVQGHDSPSATAPASGDSGWYDVVTLNSASPLEQELQDLPAWIRLNITTAGTGTITANLVGTP